MDKTDVAFMVVMWIAIVLLSGLAVIRDVNAPPPIVQADPVCVSPPPSTTADSVAAILAPQARDTTVLREIANLVVEEAERARVDPLLVARIIRRPCSLLSSCKRCFTFI